MRVNKLRELSITVNIFFVCSVMQTVKQNFFALVKQRSMEPSRNLLDNCHDFKIALFSVTAGQFLLCVHCAQLYMPQLFIFLPFVQEWKKLEI